MMIVMLCDFQACTGFAASVSPSWQPATRWKRLELDSQMIRDEVEKEGTIVDSHAQDEKNGVIFRFPKNKT